MEASPTDRRSPVARSPEEDHARFERVTAELDPPFALLDLDAFWMNAGDLIRRAAGKPIRLASKSVRCRSLQERVLKESGFRGTLAFTLPEALWLASNGFDDLVVAYPTAHRAALRDLAFLARDRPDVRLAIMIDSVGQLDLVDLVAGRRDEPIQVCMEVDAGWWVLGDRVRIGAKRSPVHTPQQAVALALAIKSMQRASARELAGRRAEIVDAVRSVTDIEFVNGGGTGSVERTSAEPSVTEVAAGSGLFGPALFDAYRGFHPQPAALFALSVVRRPRSGTVTVLGGGYLASGGADETRLPQPYLPQGLRLDRQEGAGEVQTPLHGPPALDLRIGDRVYFRHAKAGELCERFDRLYLIEGDRIVDEVPTYRGEGRCFL